MSVLRKTKIVATIGPKTESLEDLISILEAGVDICRVNCSHCDHDKIRRSIANIRRAAATLNRSVGILLDLQGPKIRTGTIEPPLDLQKGDTLTIVMSKDYTAQMNRIGTTWPSMSEDVDVGDPVLFADGALSGTVTAIRNFEDQPSEVDIEMTVAGLLQSRKGINLPSSNIKAPALTPKDEGDLVVGVEAGVDYVALSFVRHGDDLKILKSRLSDLGKPNLPVISKIEKPQAIENIQDILENTEGIMVARGDLGVEIPIARVPIVQKMLIREANRHGKLVITATQMLESMTHHPFPTRAEVTDVANAILDGSDAVMLSGETSIGEYPVRTVETMAEIALQTETTDSRHYLEIKEIIPLQGKYQSVIRAACYVAKEATRPLVVFTWSGRTAILAAKTRPQKPIFAVSPNQTVVDQMRLVWGVHAIKVPQIDSTEELIIETQLALLEQGLVQRGDEVVILGGNAPLRGASNLMKIEIIDGKYS
jgi:pyruvate kinase